MFRFFTLAPADGAFVDPGRGRGPAEWLGLAVTLCTLPWLGFVPDDVGAAQAVAVARLAGQLGVDPGVLRHYGRRPKTRTDHLRLVARYRGWRLPTSLVFKEFDEFLLARAMEHDSPALLFRLASEYFISVQVIRQGPVAVRKGSRMPASRRGGRPMTGSRTRSPSNGAPGWTGCWWWIPRSG